MDLFDIELKKLSTGEKKLLLPVATNEVFNGLLMRIVKEAETAMLGQNPDDPEFLSRYKMFKQQKDIWEGVQRATTSILKEIGS